MSSDKLARSRTALQLFALAALISSSFAALPYTGVNLSGGEWDSGPFWPTTKEIDFFASRGMNTIRLPFAWENLQPTALADFDATAWGRYTTLTDYITNTKGLYVIVEVHNFARYKGQIVGNGDVDVNVLLDLWQRLANYYKSNSKVLFNIMNEPNTMSTLLWVSNANATINTIRDTGATNILLVPGNGWTGAYSWGETWTDVPANQISNAVAMLSVVDPLDNMIIEFHQYFDSDSSGGHPDCQARPIGTSTVSVATNWLKQHNKKGFLGELGGSDRTNCINAINDALTHLEANSDVWMGWAYWSGGPRTSTAFLAIGPLGYPPVQNTQLDTVMNYVAGPITAMTFPDIPASSCSNTPAMVIYDDSLQNNWEDWGWAQSRTLSNTDKSSGTYAISFKSAGGNQGLQLTLPSGFSFVNYNAIQFDVKGASEGLNYEIYLIEGDTSPGRSQALRGFTPSHSITTAYQTAVVPFDVFHLDSSKSFISIVFQSAEDVQDTLYLDNIKLVCADITGGTLSGTVNPPGTNNSPTAGSTPSSSPSGNTPSSTTPSTRTPSANLNQATSSVIGSVAFVAVAAALLL